MADSKNVGSAGVRRRITSIVPLLPIFCAYALISLAIHRAPGDEASFLYFARNLTHGFYADTHTFLATAYLWHGPGLPALLAPLVALHAPLAVMRMLTGPVALFAAMVVFYRLARLYLRERAAVIATYVLALYLPFFTVIGVITVEPLATLCLALAALLIVRSFRGGRRDHIWAAVPLALLALSRVEFGYVLLAGLLLSGIWLLASRRSSMAQRGVVTFFVALVLCAPWLVYTYSLTGRPFYWGNSGGLGLYWMSAPGNLGDWHTQSVSTNPQLAAYQPLFRQLSRLKPPAQDSRLEHVALQNIRNDPKHYLANVVNNIDRLLFNSPYSFTNEKASSMLFEVPNAFLLSILAIALVVGIKVRRRLGPEILPLAVVTALGFAVHVPVAASSRYVIPIVPVAAWLAIAVIAPNVRLVRDLRWGAEDPEASPA